MLIVITESIEVTRSKGRKSWHFKPRGSGIHISYEYRTAKNRYILMWDGFQACKPCWIGQVVEDSRGDSVIVTAESRIGAVAAIFDFGAYYFNKGKLDASKPPGPEMLKM